MVHVSAMPLKQPIKTSNIFHSCLIATTMDSKVSTNPFDDEPDNPFWDEQIPGNVEVNRLVYFKRYSERLKFWLE